MGGPQFAERLVMQSVPGAVATGSLLIAGIEIARIVTRSLLLSVLTSSEVTIRTNNECLRKLATRLNWLSGHQDGSFRTRCNHSIGFHGTIGGVGRRTARRFFATSIRIS